MISLILYKTYLYFLENRFSYILVFKKNSIILYNLKAEMKGKILLSVSYLIISYIICRRHYSSSNYIRNFLSNS